MILIGPVIPSICRRSLVFPPQRWGITWATTALCFALHSLLPVSAPALSVDPQPFVKRMVGARSGFNSLSKQVLPDWTPTGRPDRQGNAAARAYPDFGETGQPVSHGGGASRSPISISPQCPATDIPLTVLAPVGANYGGYTTQATPTLWVYVPFTLDASNPITFVLLDDQNNSVYETFQAVNHAPGIVKLSLPADITLEVGQVYSWLFQVHCGDPLGLQQESTSVWGWVKRIEAPFEADGEATDLSHADYDVAQRIKRSHEYADYLVWYDALTLLGDGLQQSPDNPQIAQALSDLLELPSVQLGGISTALLQEEFTLGNEPVE